MAVGGSGVGRALLEKVIAAYPLAKRLTPGCEWWSSLGHVSTREPSSLAEDPGLEVRGYVDRLYRHLSV